MRHPAELGGQDINRFLSALAESGRLSASSQTQALSAVLFLYRDVLHRDVGNIGEVIRAKQPVRLPVVLSPEEVRAVLGRLEGEARIAGLLMYGGGLRLLETLQLRVKDVDFPIGQIVVRRAKGREGPSHGVGRGCDSRAQGTPRGRATTARIRPRPRWRSGTAPPCAGPEVAGGGKGVGMVVRLSGDATLPGPGVG
jgi:integrase